MRARVMSGLLGIPVILGFSYMGGPGLQALVLVLLAVAALEAGHLMSRLGYVKWRLPLIVGTLIAFAGGLGPEPGGAVLAIFFLMVLLGLFLSRAGPDSALISGMAAAFFLSVYLGFTFGFWLRLRDLPGGFTLVLVALGITWINDTAAFFTGINVGRMRLCPGISPAKTVEGALGGLLAAGLAMFLASGLLEMAPGAAVALGIAAALAAQAGDLFVSAIKRAARVKDAGGIIPGHGGIMDRFDSLSFVLPLVFYAFSTGLVR